MSQSKGKATRLYVKLIIHKTYTIKPSRESYDKVELKHIVFVEKSLYLQFIPSSLQALTKYYKRNIKL